MNGNLVRMFCPNCGNPNDFNIDQVNGIYCSRKCIFEFEQKETNDLIKEIGDLK